MIGETLAHFKITGKLGEGGMGEVYRAEDTKLGREVAIKVLPPLFAEDAERMARFSREAQVLASLNHPNIAAIYQVEHDADRHFLVMELVEGETLAERIQRGRIPVDEAMAIALQVAEALEAAHNQGIVHRDLKPANINFTGTGKIKVLDFGLAKALEAGAGVDSNPSHPSLSLSPTMTAQMTGVGVLMGTAAYMSPEQARGEPADRRADIWAFGVVLMEMLTGQTVYAGKTMSDTLAGILAREPEWNQLPDDLPPAVRNLLDRCLQKETTDRLQAVGEARIAIANYLADPEAAKLEGVTVDYAPQPAWKRALPWAALALAFAAGLAAIAGWTREPVLPEPDSMYLNVEMPVDRTLLTQIGSSVVLSPDGTKLAYVTGDPATRSLHLRDLNQLEGRMLPGGELAYLPFFSPDGEWIAFVTPGELKKVSVAGGTPLTIAELNFCRGATWTVDDSIVYTPEQEAPLFRIPAAGGEPEQLTTLDIESGEVTHRWPWALPDGKTVLFVSHTQNSQFAEATIEALDLETLERKVLVRGGTYPRWANSGHLLYVREGTLYGVPMDPTTLELQGSPGPVIEDVTSNEGAYGTAHYSVSDQGKLIYMQGSSVATGYGVVRVDREGTTSPLIEELGIYWHPAISPDGKKLAVSLLPSGSNGDLWVEDLDRNIRSRLTFADGNDNYPTWSPDGEWIYFSSNRGKSFDLYRVAADGSEQPVQLTEDEFNQNPTSVTPDGKFLIYHQQNAETSWDILFMPLDAEGDPEVFLSTPFNEGDGQVSPDGNWIAYNSNESGTFQIYVRPFPEGRGEWRISEEPSGHPFWSPDGTELFYRTGTGIAVAAIDTSGGTLRAKRPEVLFDGNFINLFPARDWTLSPEGPTPIMLQGVDSTEKVDHVVMITNWFAELEETFAAAP